MAGITFDGRSEVLITPVTVNEDDEVVTMGLPIKVQLQELADWIVNNGVTEE